jgi:hypothetical protein
MEVLVKSTERNFARKSEKYASLASLKLGFRADEIIFLIGSRQLFDEMVAAKWLVPVINRHKLQIFDRGQVSRAWARILNGDLPPRLATRPIHNSSRKNDKASTAAQPGLRRISAHRRSDTGIAGHRGAKPGGYAADTSHKVRACLGRSRTRSA